MVGGDGAKVLEQAGAGTKPLAGLLPVDFDQVADVVHGEGQASAPSRSGTPVIQR